MSQGQLTGSAIREHRQRIGLRQIELAKRVGISASYFNQIEHNRRRIGGKLLSDIATALRVDPAILAEGANARLIESLRDAQASEQGLKGDFDIPESFAGRFPAWARLLAARHKRVQTLELMVETLNDRLAHDSQLGDALHELLSTVTAISSSASILDDEPNLEAAWRNRFQRNIIEDSARLSRGAQSLVTYLDMNESTPAGSVSPRDELEQFLEDHSHHFPSLETDGFGAIDAVIAKSGRLKSPQSRVMAQLHLGSYLQDAIKIPLEEAAAAIDSYGIDPMKIARDFRTDLAAAIRRLAALPSALLPSPVGLAVCDISGTLTLKKQVEGFSLPRHTGACSLLPLFQCLTQPLRPIMRVLEQSGRDNGRVLTYSIAAPVDDIGLNDDLILKAHMLIIPQPQTAAKTPPHSQIGKVGLSCGICLVQDCRARREPPVQDRTKT